MDSGLIPRITTWPDGNVPSSQLIEHHGIASVTRPHVALSGLYQSVVIHSVIHQYQRRPDEQAKCVTEKVENQINQETSYCSNKQQTLSWQQQQITQT
jgi:hypothetical protein